MLGLGQRVTKQDQIIEGDEHIVRLRIGAFAWLGAC